MNVRKNFRQKAASIVIGVFIGLGICNTVSAGTYASQIDEVMSDKSFNDTMSNTVFQQISNGGYRTVDMLEIIARELDDSGDYGSAIDSVMSDKSFNDTMSDTVY